MRVVLHIDDQRYPFLRPIVTSMVSTMWWHESVDIVWLDSATLLHESEAPQVLSVAISEFANSLNHSSTTLGSIDWQHGYPGRIVRVSLTAITTWLSREVASVDDALLARAAAIVLAHEIGHYVLGSPSHAESGLMKEHFTLADLSERMVLGLDESTRASLRAAFRKCRPVRQHVQPRHPSLEGCNNADAQVVPPFGPSDWPYLWDCDSLDS